MNHPHGQPTPILTLPQGEKDPLSIRAKALVFSDPSSLQRSRERRGGVSAGLKKPMVSRCSWMKSATCHCPCR
jgi:hypothetical protein